MSRLRQADLFKIMQPQAFGGFEYGFDALTEIVATIARGCGSTGWVYSLLASHQWLIACFSREVQEEVWCDGGGVAAGSYAPVGRAVSVPGGYRLSTRGSFCSGCDNAQWQLLGGTIPNADGPPRPGFFLVPTADCTIDDNWHTMGLAGTGSKTVVANEVFVPFRRTVLFSELSDASAPGMRENPNPLYRQPFLAVISINIVAPLLGIAEGALADFLDMVSVRSTRTTIGGGGVLMAELAAMQTRVARASALIDAARLLVVRDLKETYDNSVSTQSLGIGLRLRESAGSSILWSAFGRRNRRVVRGVRRSRSIFGPPIATQLARCTCGRLSYQFKLGLCWQHVRTVLAWARTERKVLAPTLTMPTSGLAYYCDQC